MNNDTHNTDQPQKHSKPLSIKDKENDALRKRTLKIKAERAKSLLENVFSKMDLLEIDNFDSLFPLLISNMKEAAVLREELIKEIGSERLIKIRPELFSVAKQIEKKYDNVVEKYALEVKQLQKELAEVNSKKKLTNYLRY